MPRFSRNNKFSQNWNEISEMYPCLVTLLFTYWNFISKGLKISIPALGGINRSLYAFYFSIRHLDSLACEIRVICSFILFFRNFINHVGIVVSFCCTFIWTRCHSLSIRRRKIVLNMIRNWSREKEKSKKNASSPRGI